MPSLINSKKLFGVALDPSDDPMNMELKKAWMMQAEQGASNTLLWRDPYDAILDTMKDMLCERGIDAAGKFLVPSWLQPRPEQSDEPMVTVENIGEFYDGGGMQRLLEQLKQFVEEKILPETPVMAGIDHAATMQVIAALAEKYGSNNLGVIALDQHFDAIPLSVRLAETSSHYEDVSAIALGLKDQCCCGNFWSFLIDNGVLLPQNLAVIGVADYPGDRLAGKESPFRDCYLDFEKRGCRFFPLQKFDGDFHNELERFIDEAASYPYLYVSLDLDAGSYNSTLAARYMDMPGLSRQDILDTACIIAVKQQRGDFTIAGLDVMEFNIHFLGLDSGGGMKDETLGLVKDFVSLLTG